MALPTGVSPNEAMALFHKFGGKSCLQKVTMDMIDKLMEEIGDDVLLFVPHDYAEWLRMPFLA